MLTNFRNIISLTNLRSKPQGQVATLLILMMVAVLILILVTVNLGTLSLQATTLSNAADAGSLYLASQLSTKANVLWKSLGQTTERCKKGGWASIIFAIVLAIVAVVVTILSYGTAAAPMWALVAAGAAGGAVGGAAGGAYAGTGATRGAIQGAVIGAAIGYGAGATTVGAGGTTTGAGTAGANTTIAASSTAAATPVAFGTPVAAGTYVATGSVIVPASAGAVAANTALIAGAALYNQSVESRMTSDAFAAAAKALNGLPEYDQYREGVFLQALSQTIDDPNTVADAYDSDGDGDTQEKVPYFQYWWDRRIQELKNIIPTLKSLTDNFVKGPLSDAQEFAKEQYTVSCTRDADEGVICTPAFLGRKEVEDFDGPVAAVARALENAGYDTSFYKPGTPPPDDPDCDECGPDDYYDKIDAVSGSLKNFVSTIEQLKTQDINQLTATHQSWVIWFYDPDTEWAPDNDAVNADWYDVFKNSIEPEVGAWSSELETKRQALPQCSYNEDEDRGRYAANPPCQDGAFATVDADLNDEFQEAKKAISNFISEIQGYRNSFRDYYTNMENAYRVLAEEYGGLNPATYKWQDSRGSHSITTEASSFKIPRIEVKKSGGFLKKKICLVLRDYSDDGSRTWIKITRSDPANKELKSGKVSLGLWNPFVSGEITKTSKAYYSYDKAGIAGK